MVWFGRLLLANMSNTCQVVWIIHESKSRLILPFVTELRQLGYHSDVHFFEQDHKEFLQNFASDTHTLVVFHSFEDYLYAKNVWSWESQESKPCTRVTSVTDLLIYQLDHTSFCCIHDHDNHEKIDLQGDLVASLTRFHVVPDEVGLVEYVVQTYPPPSHPSESVLTHPLVPLAARVVIIRHAQR